MDSMKITWWKLSSFVSSCIGIYFTWKYLTA